MGIWLHSIPLLVFMIQPHLAKLCRMIGVCACICLKLFNYTIKYDFILHYVWYTNISVKHQTLLHVFYLYSVVLIRSITIITLIHFIINFSEATRETFSSSFVPFSHLVGLSGKKHPRTQICFSVTFRSETFSRARTIRLDRRSASVGSRLAYQNLISRCFIEQALR